jgi:hypothetical protein
VSNHTQEMIDFEDLLDNGKIYENKKHVLMNESFIDFRNVNFVKKVTIKDNKFFYDEEEFIFFSSENEPRFLNKVRFELTDCIFQDEFSLTENIPNQMILSNCDFNGVSLSNIDIKTKDEYSDKLEIRNCNIQNLYIQHCQFDIPISIITQSHLNSIIEELYISDVVFKKAVYIQSYKINSIDMEGITFEADFGVSYSYLYNQIFIHACEFEGAMNFEETDCYAQLDFDKSQFKSHTVFKNTKLHEGIKLDYVNLGTLVNFFGLKELDAKKSIENTSQESYRIIKNQFDKIGNNFEANKYHSLELAKARKTSPICSLDYIVLLFHFVFSIHSKNWLLSLFWIAMVGIFTAFCLSGFRFMEYKNFLYESVKYISIVNLDDELKKHPILFVFNKASLGYLYYLFVTAIRKNTRK